MRFKPSPDELLPLALPGDAQDMKNLQDKDDECLGIKCDG